ncbi:MAG: hypothetical protein EBQ96_08510 [Proteobacteria bacterium]|nr:hypothetical protein [Pseudomonadota bacterium]
MTRSKTLFAALLATVFFSPLAFALEGTAPEPQSNQIVFQNTGVDAERKAYLDINPDVTEAMAAGTVKPEDIGIATRDLNKDGKDEVLVYVRSSFFCGTLGCRFSINEFSDGSMNPLSDILTVHENITYADTEHNGYQDIVIDPGNGKPLVWAYDSSMSKYNPVGEDGKGIDPSLQYQGNPVTGESAPIIDKPAGRQTQEQRDKNQESDSDVKF